MYITQFFQRLMLTDEEIGILTRLFDKAGITFGEAESEANSQGFNLIDFMYKLYFHSSVEAVFTVNRKNITNDDREQINRLISKNTAYVLEATETTRNNITDRLSGGNIELKNNDYFEGFNKGREIGYDEGRKEVIKELELYFYCILSSTPRFIVGFTEGLSKSHFHIPCSGCRKPIHIDESGGDWNKILPKIEKLLEGCVGEKFNNRTDIDSKELRFIDHPSFPDKNKTESELYKLSYKIGQMHEHIRLVNWENGTVRHFDQTDKNWPVIKRKLEDGLTGYYHSICLPYTDKND